MCACKCVHMIQLFELSFVNMNVYFQSVFIGEENALL